MIAKFIRFYPSYRYRDVMQEQSRIFFLLLKQISLLKAEEGLTDIMHITLPHIKPNSANNIINRYKDIIRSQTEVQEYTDYSSLTKLKTWLKK